MNVPDESVAECAGAAGPLSRRRIFWDLGELIIGYGLILAVIWTPHPLQHWLYLLALGWFIISIALSFEGLKAMGCSLVGFWRSSWVVVAAFLMAAAAAVLAGTLHTLHHPGAPSQWVQAFAGYTVWALTQQLLLQGYFLARLLRILSNPTYAAVLTASVFAFAHLPNPILTPLTLIWGLAACMVFIRSRNVYPLAIAHAILGIGLAITVPASVLHNMRVGLGYIEYVPRPVHLSQMDHTVSTEAWVRADAAMRLWDRHARP